MKKRAMFCPECNQRSTRVDRGIEKTDGDGWITIVRTRRCPNGHSFKTYECHEYADVEVVFKAREAFEILKSISSLAETIT